MNVQRGCFALIPVLTQNWVGLTSCKSMTTNAKRDEERTREREREREREITERTETECGRERFRTIALA